MKGLSVGLLVLDVFLSSFLKTRRCLRKGTGNINIRRGTRETVTDLNGSFRSRYPVSVENERTSFATCASAMKSTRLVIRF